MNALRCTADHSVRRHLLRFKIRAQAVRMACIEASACRVIYTHDSSDLGETVRHTADEHLSSLRMTPTPPAQDIVAPGRCPAMRFADSGGLERRSSSATMAGLLVLTAPGLAADRD